MCAHVHRHADSGVCARACVYLYGYVCASWVGICVQHTYVCLSVRVSVCVCACMYIV